MGFMPEETSLTMVIGLRMEYLSRSEAVRAHVLGRLKKGQDAFGIASSINIAAGAVQAGSPALVIDVRNNDRQAFADKLEALVPGLGKEYLQEEEAILYQANRDSGGNRNAILNWWQKLPSFSNDIRDALVAALTMDRPIRVRWECTIRSTDPTAGAVVFTVENGVPTVIFLTTSAQDSSGGPILSADVAR